MKKQKLMTARSMICALTLAVMIAIAIASARAIEHGAGGRTAGSRPTRRQ